MNRKINLLSDTTTLPTDKMRVAMQNAEVGDDVAKSDPTIIKLQELAAKVTGKEAALFMPSGTMANLAAIMSHCNAGEEVIIEENAHIVYYECGNIARIAGVMPRLVKGTNGIMNPQDVEDAFRPDNVHFPKTSLVCVENTHNIGGGYVYPLENLEKIKKIAENHNVKVHMDGARVFNAATYLNVDVKEITKHTDSLMFCLSKGLSAPVGSMLCGTEEFIAKALRNRKALGGGMRQAGVLAAAGIIAINEMVGRLKEDHENARLLAEGLNKNPNVMVDLEHLHTNLVFLNVSGNITAGELQQRLEKDYNILSGHSAPTKIRMVTNRHVSKEDVEYVIQCVNEISK